jgi:hypothetical protein
MSDASVDHKTAGTRFPFINLQKAIGQAKKLFDADQKGREMAISGAFGVWDYSEKSSGGFQTIAALKMYGLLKDSNGGDSRKVGLTDSALRYFRDERDDEKKKLVREFALKPKLIAALWADWHTTPPGDTIARSHLKTDRGLNEQGARSLLSIYKENLVFAELKADDKVPEPSNEDEDEPMAPASKHEFSGFAAKPSPVIPTPVSVRQAVFPLLEGDVTLSFPRTMSSASAKALASYISLFLEQTRLQAEERERWREEHGREADDD